MKKEQYNNKKCDCMNLAKDPQNFPPKKSQAIQSIKKNHNKRKQDFEPKGNSL